MSHIKKRVLRFFSPALVFAVPFLAQAQAYMDSAGGAELPEGSIYEIISVTMEWLLAILGFIAIIGFVISGILYLTAAGNTKQIETAKTAMWYSILGVIVALMGYVILQAVDLWLDAGTNF